MLVVCPTISAWIVSPARVQIAAKAVQSAPDDHLTAGPDRRVKVPASGRVGGAGGCPTVTCWDCIFRRCSKSQWGSSSRPTRSFHCQSRRPHAEFGRRARSLCWWLSNCRYSDCISRRCYSRQPSSAPDNHFGAGPHCRVRVSGSRHIGECWWLSKCRCWDCICRRCSTRKGPARPRQSFRCRSTLPCELPGRWCVSGARRCPTVGDRIISSAGVRMTGLSAAPDDHFAPGPDCRVIASAIRRAGGTGGCPTVCAGIVSSAGIQEC